MPQTLRNGSTLFLCNHWCKEMGKQTYWNKHWEKLKHGAIEHVINFIHFAYCCSFTSVWLRQTPRLDQSTIRPVLLFPVFYVDWPYSNLTESFRGEVVL